MFENYSFDYRQIDLQRGVSKVEQPLTPLPRCKSEEGGGWVRLHDHTQRPEVASRVLESLFIVISIGFFSSDPGSPIS